MTVQACWITISKADSEVRSMVHCCPASRVALVALEANRFLTAAPDGVGGWYPKSDSDFVDCEVLSVPEIRGLTVKFRADGDVLVMAKWMPCFAGLAEVSLHFLFDGVSGAGTSTRLPTCPVIVPSAKEEVMIRRESEYILIERFPVKKILPEKLEYSRGNFHGCKSC